MRLFKFAGFLGYGPCKTSFLVAEKFTYTTVSITYKSYQGPDFLYRSTVSNNFHIDWLFSF